LGIAELSLFTQKRFIGLHKFSSFVEAKIFQRKSQGFSQLSKLNGSSLNDLPPSALKMFTFFLFF